ncbi:hypothetical protein GN956_G13884 [Arapaima gigas]
MKLLSGRISLLNNSPMELQDDVFWETYKPPARDAITLPKYVLYLVLAFLVVLMALFAIIRHLIADLIHDLADWLFGEQQEEVVVNFCDNREKFMADWCPETSPELEEMAREEQIKVVMQGNEDMPGIWVTLDAQDPPPTCSGPRVSFGSIDYVSSSNG